MPTPVPPPVKVDTGRVGKFGVNDLRGWWLGSPNLPDGYPVQAHRDLATRDLTAMAAAKLTYRCGFDLAALDDDGDGAVEPDDWAMPDALFQTVAERGVSVLAVLTSSTSPVTASQRTSFALVARAFVARYGEDGSFWSDHPDLTPRPIDTAELLNEQNQTHYFTGTPQDYGKLLGRTWQQIRSTTIGFQLLSGGLAERSSNGQRPAAWLAAALEAADDEFPAPQANPYFAIKGVGFHPYGGMTASVADAKANTTAFSKELATALPARAVPPLWITEFGWRSSPTTDPVKQSYSESDLLSRYKDLVGWLLTGAAPPIGTIAAYAYRDGGTTTADDGFGWNATAGTLLGDDTTQAHRGTQRAHGTWFTQRSIDWTP